MCKKGLLCFLLIFLLILTGILTACGDAGGEDASVTTLIYANLTDGPGGADRAAVERFNRMHRNVQIEIRDYFDEDGLSGRERLMVEMAAGKIPDIIDLGNGFSFSQLPYQVLARKGYLEDLWPYIENDPELGRDGVLEAPLKAAEVDGGLYVLFGGVRINTLAGAESIVGDRTSWTLTELQDAFASMPEESTILPFYYQKLDTFFYMMCMNLDGYVDWETGQCFFDNDSFRDALWFVNSFPDEVSYGEDVGVEVVERLLHGKQMLWVYPLFNIMYIQQIDAMIGRGGRASFVGYPTADGSTGSSFDPVGPKLSISASCQDKEAAWEFLRQMILPQYDRERLREGDVPSFIPINREDYDNVRAVSQSKNFMPKRLGFNYPPDTIYVECHQVTDEEWERFEGLINRIDKVDMYDPNIFNIVWEATGAYFAGDKTLDETVQMIQNRVGLYVNEQR